MFAVYLGYGAHPKLKTFVETFDPNNPTMPPDTFYFMPDKKWVTANGEVTHILALANNAASGLLLVYVEFFNFARVAVLLPFKGIECVRETYAVDIPSGKEVVARIDEVAPGAVNWAATHELGDDYLFEFTQSRFSEIVEIAQKRVWDHITSNIVEKALGSADGQLLTAGKMVSVATEVALFLKRWWKHPASTRDIRQRELEGFWLPGAQLATFFPIQVHSEFYHFFERLHRSLAATAACQAAD
jgi:hypothetical protein